MQEFGFLNPRKVKFYKKAEGKLAANIEGQEYIIGELKESFPLSHEGLFVRLKGEMGEKELGMIKNIDELSPDSRKVVKKELEKYYFMPRIKKINRIKETYGITYWNVETNKGPRSFEVRDRQINIRRLGKNRVIIKDLDGNRFEIPDYTKLDKKSIRQLISEI